MNLLSQVQEEEDDDALHAVIPSEVRARRRPTSVLFVWAFELAWSLVVATPTHAWARHAWGTHPDGDAVLFRPGARELMVWVGAEADTLPVVARTTFLLVVVGVVLSQVVLGALLASLAFGRGSERTAWRSPRTVDAFRSGVATFLPLSGILTLVGGTQLVILAAGAGLSGIVARPLIARLGEPGALDLRLGVFAFFAIAAVLVGIVGDVARAAVVRETGCGRSAPARPAWSSVLRGLVVALSLPKQVLGKAAFAWTWRAVVAGAFLVVGYVAAGALGGRGGLALVGLAAIHQLCVLGRAALRASWLARALQAAAATGAVSEPDSDTPAHSVEPPAPSPDRGA